MKFFQQQKSNRKIAVGFDDLWETVGVALREARQVNSTVTADDKLVSGHALQKTRLTRQVECMDFVEPHDDREINLRCLLLEP